jgi:SAM-dependent methyltransferase
MLSLGAGCATTDPAPPTAAAGRADYQPTRGQFGKDVIWIPTPDRLVQRMLQLGQVRADDQVVDLGSGDGKIVIAAARDHAASALGIEYNPDMVGVARREAERQGVSGRAQFRQGDIFAVDFGDATVVTMYLLPQLNLRLRERLLRMRPGTRVVSHAWSMGNWQPDETSWIASTPLFLWIVPANAGGRWALSFPQGTRPAEAEMTVMQTFQRLSGAKVEFDGLANTVRDLRLLGNRIRFAFTDVTGTLRTFDGRIDGDRMTGEVTGPAGGATPFSGRRIGAAPPVGGASGFSDEEVGRLEAELGG